MRQIFLIIAFVLMIASSKNSDAQSNNVSSAYSNSIALSTAHSKAIPPGKKRFKARAENVNANVLDKFTRSNNILSETKVTNVNIDAVRDFTRSHKNISDAKWYKTEAGYLANFLSGGIYTKIVYDDKGRWLYNLLEYTEANMAFEIRHLVKRKYYDDDILIVHQYEFDDNKTVYIIRLQDKKSNIKTIKVCDEEIKDITQREKN
jgi:hypothetical protein